jgi:hypothetical protein
MRFVTALVLLGGLCSYSPLLAQTHCANTSSWCSTQVVYPSACQQSCQTYYPAPSACCPPFVCFPVAEPRVDPCKICLLREVADYPAYSLYYAQYCYPSPTSPTSGGYTHPDGDLCNSGCTMYCDGNCTPSGTCIDPNEKKHKPQPTSGAVGQGVYNQTPGAFRLKDFDSAERKVIWYKDPLQTGVHRYAEIFKVAVADHDGTKPATLNFGHEINHGHENEKQGHVVEVVDSFGVKIRVGSDIYLVHTQNLVRIITEKPEPQPTPAS